MMNKISLILFLLIIGFGAQAQLSLEFDKKKISRGEVFRLTLISDDLPVPEMPDLTPLQQDFNIVGTERRVNYTVINGQSQSHNEWIMMLMPKHAGILNIPIIHLGQQHTQVETIEVSENNVKNSQFSKSPQGTKLLAEVSETTPYINQQVIYTVKLSNKQHLYDADYQEPHVKDALLIPLGDSRRYQNNEQGVLYAVEEQHYAIFPQKSGDLTIQPPRFNALTYERIPQKISLTAKPIKLHIKSIPTQQQGKIWLPAKNVLLSENYERQQTSLPQGTTLVRTITVEAVGIAAQLIPLLDFKNQAQFNIYPQKPHEKTFFRSPDLMGISTVKLTYLFNQPGPVTIPELQLPWFNTATGQSNIARLPARHFTITPPTASGPSLNSPSTLSHPQKTGSTVTGQSPSSSVGSEHLPNNIGWLLAAVFAGAWMITLFLWGRYQRKQGINPKQKPLKLVQEACLANDPYAAKEALLAWAREKWPASNYLNLTDIIKKIDDVNLKKQLNKLSQALYQLSPQPWEGKELWHAIAAYRVKPLRKSTKDNSLPPLYPK